MVDDGFSALGPAEKMKIESLDHQLGDVISDYQSGKDNFGSFFYVAQQLDSLSDNPYIPDSVKESLKEASDELKKAPDLNLSRLMHAKEEIDSLIHRNNTNENNHL